MTPGILQKIKEFWAFFCKMGLSKTASGGRQYKRFVESDKITVCHCSVVFISFSYGVVGMTNLKKAASASIWWFAFGYFAVYIPYSFGTKVLTKGLLADNTMDAAQKAALTVSSGELLPPTILASIVVMIIFISSMRWWKYATQWHLGGLSLPRPRLSTLFSGICTGVVVVTTTLAYTINGVTIVTAMLFMRGGMLIMSPIVDTLFKRHVRWFSWAALGMSLLALIVSSPASGLPRPAPRGLSYSSSCARRPGNRGPCAPPMRAVEARRAPSATRPPPEF